MRRVVMAAVLTLTAYLTGTYPLGVASATFNRFGYEIGRLTD